MCVWISTWKPSTRADISSWNLCQAACHCLLIPPPPALSRCLCRRDNLAGGRRQSYKGEAFSVCLCLQCLTAEERGLAPNRHWLCLCEFISEVQSAGAPTTTVRMCVCVETAEACSRPPGATWVPHLSLLHHRPLLFLYSLCCKPEQSRRTLQSFFFRNLTPLPLLFPTGFHKGLDQNTWGKRDLKKQIHYREPIITNLTVQLHPSVVTADDCHLRGLT